MKRHVIIALLAALTAGGAAARDFEAGYSWLKAHNAERARVGVPPLVWSVEAEEHARAWAARLAASRKLEHSDVEAMGENLFASGGGGPPSAEEVVDDWASEKSKFDPKSRRCKGQWYECGHYTQVIWKDTTAVGCAMALAPKGEFQYYVVCNYVPPGNYEGRNPY